MSDTTSALRGSPQRNGSLANDLDPEEVKRTLGRIFDVRDERDLLKIDLERLKQEKTVLEGNLAFVERQLANVKAAHEKEIAVLRARHETDVARLIRAEVHLGTATDELLKAVQALRAETGVKAEHTDHPNAQR